MTDLLMGNTNAALQQFNFNQKGADNVERLLDALEMIAHVLEKPNESIYWLDIDSARWDGITPNVWKFPSIIGKHFPSNVKDFLNETVDEIDFQVFENECLQSCARLDSDQIFSALSNILTLYKLTRQ